MFHHSYREYEVDVANAVTKRELLVEAQRHRAATRVSSTRGETRATFSAWLKALRASFETRLRPVEDEGYIA